MSSPKRGRPESLRTANLAQLDGDQLAPEVPDAEILEVQSGLRDKSAEQINQETVSLPVSPVVDGTAKQAAEIAAEIAAGGMGMDVPEMAQEEEEPEPPPPQGPTVSEAASDPAAMDSLFNFDGCAAATGGGTTFTRGPLTREHCEAWRGEPGFGATFFEQARDCPGAEVFVLNAGDASTGVACVLVKPHGRGVCVVDIIVRNAERCKGHGSAIFTHAVQELLANSAVSIVQLNVVNRSVMTKLVRRCLAASEGVVCGPQRCTDTWVLSRHGASLHPQQQQQQERAQAQASAEARTYFQTGTDLPNPKPPSDEEHLKSYVEDAAAVDGEASSDEDEGSESEDEESEKEEDPQNDSHAFHRKADRTRGRARVPSDEEEEEDPLKCYHTGDRFEATHECSGQLFRVDQCELADFQDAASQVGIEPLPIGQQEEEEQDDEDEQDGENDQDEQEDDEQEDDEQEDDEQEEEQEDQDDEDDPDDEDDEQLEYGDNAAEIAAALNAADPEAEESDGEEDGGSAAGNDADESNVDPLSFADGDDLGGSFTQDAPDPPKKTPFEAGVDIINEIAFRDQWAKELLPKLQGVVPVQKKNPHYYEIVTTKQDGVTAPMTMKQLLNKFARENRSLNKLLNRHASLRKQLVSHLLEADDEDFPIIQRDEMCCSYLNGFLIWGKGAPDSRTLLQIHFWMHDDYLAPSFERICRQHIDEDFDEDWLRQHLDQLVEDSPSFKQFIECKFPPDDVYPFGFSDGRDGDTMDVSVRDAFLGFHGRLFTPVRRTDNWRAGNYDYGDTGSGKTQLYELIEYLHGEQYCQTMQDPKHVDKFSINSNTTKLRMLTAQDFGEGEPLTAAQVQKMLGGEKTGTRNMMTTDGPESQWTVPLWFIGNFPPPWADKAGALNNRLLQWHWGPLEGRADDGLLEKMKKEPRVLLIFLKAYEKLRNHIKDTPSQQWKWQYFDEARKEEAVRQMPVVEFLGCGSFQHLQVTYTIAPETDATVLLSRLKEVYKKFRESKGMPPTDEISDSALKGHLKQASTHLGQNPPMDLVTARNRWYCQSCDADVPEEGDESNCAADCAYQCPPGVYLSGHDQRLQFFRPPVTRQANKAPSKVWRGQKGLGANKFVKNLRVADDAGSMVPEDDA